MEPPSYVAMVATAITTTLGHITIQTPITTLKVQVPNNHIHAQNMHYNYYFPKPKYLIIEYLDPLGKLKSQRRSREALSV